jgi:hypothetical protein
VPPGTAGQALEAVWEDSDGEASERAVRSRIVMHQVKNAFWYLRGGMRVVIAGVNAGAASAHDRLIEGRLCE